MLRVVVPILLVAGSARADTLFSVGVGPYVEPLRYKGPGNIDPGEIELSDTSKGAVIPLRITWTQDQRRPHALGVVFAFTPAIGEAELGQSTRGSHAMLEVIGRVGVHRASSWSLFVGAGGALERSLGGGDNGVLSNDNVEPFTTMAGGTVSASVTWFGTNRDYTLDLRAGLLASSHMRGIPVLLTASAEWGRD